MLEAFARFTVQLHEKGIEHRDFNHGNILWERTPAGAYRFQLIDTTACISTTGPSPPGPV